MNLSLPYPPSLTQLRHQARSILKDLKHGKASACEVLRRLRRFQNASEQDILSSEVALHEAQFALAMQYGFKSWAALKHHVLLTRSEAVPARVRIDGGRVWIEGVPDPGFPARGSCSFAGALSAALETTKRPFSYSDIMGYSGLAFRTRWFQAHGQKGWCPSSCVGEFTPEIRAVERCTGWKVSDHWGKQEDDPHMEDHAAQVADSIRSGMPVIGYPRLGNWNVGVAYGFEADEETISVLWKDPFSKELSVESKELGPMLVFLSDESPSAFPPTEAFIHAIGGGWWREGADRTEHNDKGYYLLGDQALARWQEDIAASDIFTDEQQRSLFSVSWWCYKCLLDSRSSAVKFLNSNAERHEGPVRSWIEQAGRIYEDEVRLLSAPFETKNAFLGPWTGKDFAAWDADTRKREASILASVRGIDSRATDYLQRAAEAWREPLKNP